MTSPRHDAPQPDDDASDTAEAQLAAGDTDTDTDTDVDADACALHTEHASIARCARCEALVCHQCHIADLRGFVICPACRVPLTQQVHGTPWDDPQQTSSTTAFAQTWYDVMRSPSTFWQEISPSSRWLPPAVFGLICLSLGIVAQTAWTLSLQPEHEAKLREAMQLDLPTQTLRMLSLGRVIIIAPLTLLVHTAVLNTAVRLAGGSPTFSLTLRIFGYACAASLLRLLPPIFGFPIGSMLMIMWIFQIEQAGIQRYYGLDRTRAMFVTLGTMLMMILSGLL